MLPTVSQTTRSITSWTLASGHLAVILSKVADKTAPRIGTISVMFRSHLVIVFSEAPPTATAKRAFFIGRLATKTSYITFWQLCAAHLHFATDL